MAKKILIVDDDKDLVDSLTGVLRQSQYDVAAAFSGTDGLHALLRERPDLVILDVMMENDTAGFEVACQIRSTRPTSRYKEVKDVPIIMLTAINQVTNNRFSMNQEESFLPNVSDFLTKPVRIEELLERIKKLI